MWQGLKENETIWYLHISLFDTSGHITKDNKNNQKGRD